MAYAFDAPDIIDTVPCSSCGAEIGQWCVTKKSVWHKVHDGQPGIDRQRRVWARSTTAFVDSPGQGHDFLTYPHTARKKEHHRVIVCKDEDDGRQV